jgi:hypothetical protein
MKKVAPRTLCEASGSATRCASDAPELVGSVGSTGYGTAPVQAV